MKSQFYNYNIKLLDKTWKYDLYIIHILIANLHHLLIN